MKRTVILASILGGSLVGTTAFAQEAAVGGGGARGIGVGVQRMLYGGQGVSVAYDGGAFHLDGHLGAEDFGQRRGTSYSLGARGWFHLHQTGASDFSIGGGLGFLHAGDDDNTLSIEAGMLIRVFVASNVALGAFAGLAVVPHNEAHDGFALNGQLLGGLSLHYFFR